MSIKISYNTLVYVNEDVEKSIERLARFGYDGVDLVGEPERYDAAQVRALLGRYKIAASSICAVFSAERDFASSKPEVRKNAVDYVKRCVDFAKEMESLGVQYLICTDIHQDGTMNGPNLVMLDKLNRAVHCHIIASGGVSSLLDIVSLYDLGLYGAIAGKSLYTGALDLRTAIIACHKISGKSAAGDMPEDELDLYFTKSDLLPAIIQDDDTNEVLMLAYMNRESFRKSLETGYTWFYSRSRKTLWNKGETSGHTQKIVSVFSDCDDDTLLIRVKQKGPACHTGSHSCFFKRLRGEESPKGE